VKKQFKIQRTGQTITNQNLKQDRARGGDFVAVCLGNYVCV
jgi:hypothetical protein